MNRVKLSTSALTQQVRYKVHGLEVDNTEELLSFFLDFSDKTIEEYVSACGTQ